MNLISVLFLALGKMCKALSEKVKKCLKYFHVRETQNLVWLIMIMTNVFTLIKFQEEQTIILHLLSQEDFILTFKGAVFILSFYFYSARLRPSPGASGAS